MTGGHMVVVSGSEGMQAGADDGGALADMDRDLDERYSLEPWLPTPLLDDIAALAGLLYARMQLRTVVTGEPFSYSEALALAGCLESGRRVAHERLQEVLGRGPEKVRSIVQYLSRVGLVIDYGATVALIDRPVDIEVFVDNGDGWRPVEPGSAPILGQSGRVRIVASSHLTLELRVCRVFHRASGGTTMRSITMKRISRRRPAVVELELDELCGGEEPGVEQILMHVAWPAMSLGDWDLYEAPPACPPRNLSEQVERERRELCHSAGVGWVTEYLFANAS